MSEPVAAAIQALELDAVEVRTRAVLGEELFWFPVRHHSPAVARHLLAALEDRKPSLIFIEAPSDAAELLRFVVDSKTRPPVALYSSYRDDDNVLGLAGIESPGPDVPLKTASWYPLLPYSPEYVAMKEAKRLGAEVVFMDLPHHGQLSSAAERGLAGRVPEHAS